MLISSPHKLNLCSDSQETCFLRNVFEAVQNTNHTSFIGSKTTRLRLMVLNPIKHSCSFFKHYFKIMCIKHKLTPLMITHLLLPLIIFIHNSKDNDNDNNNNHHHHRHHNKKKNYYSHDFY